MKTGRTWMAATVVALTMVACQESRTERLEREARHFTEKQCPQPTDPITTCDSTVFRAKGDRTYRYYYTVKGDSDTIAALQSQRELLFQNMRGRIRNAVDPVLKLIKEEGLTIMYVYHSEQTGEAFLTVKFEPEDYQ